jgi:hypothetical protein
MGGEEITPEYYRAHVPPGMNTVAFGVDGDRYTQEHYDVLGPLARLGWVEIRAPELALDFGCSAPLAASIRTPARSSATNVE